MYDLIMKCECKSVKLIIVVLTCFLKYGYIIGEVIFGVSVYFGFQKKRHDGIKGRKGFGQGGGGV